MDIVEETYFSILRGFSEDELARKIINESVYAYEELKPLIEVVYAKIISEKKCTLSLEEILELISSESIRQKLKENCVLHVCFLRCLDELDWLSSSQAEEIKQRIARDDGLLVSGISGKEGHFLIVIRTPFKANVVYSVLYHELVHFLQNAVGCSLHKIVAKSISCSEEEAKDIIETLDLDLEKPEDPKESPLSSAFRYFYDKEELEAFIANIFNELEEFFKEQRIEFTRELLRDILEAFNHRSDSFFSYYFEVNKSLVTLRMKFSKLSALRFFKLLYIYGYFRKGFLTVKTHLFSYYDKNRS